MNSLNHFPQQQHVVDILMCDVIWTFVNSNFLIRLPGTLSQGNVSSEQLHFAFALMLMSDRDFQLHPGGLRDWTDQQLFINL